MGVHADDLMAVAFDGSEQAVALPARRGFDEHPAKAPEHAKECPHDKVCRVHKEDLVVGDRVGMKIEALGYETMPGSFGVHADDQQLDAVLVTERRVVHRFFNILNVGPAEFDAGHGLCPTDDKHARHLSSILFHK